MEKKRVYLSTQRLVFLGLMAALNVVLSRFSVQLSSEVRLSVLGFLPMAMAGMLLGPGYGAAVGAIGDVLNFLLFTHVYGGYFPGYTLTAALSGMWYGLVLHGKPVTWKRALLAVLPVIALGEIGLNSVWVYMMYYKTFWVKLPLRIITNVIEMPVKTLLLMGTTRLISRIPKRYLSL